MKLKEVYLQIIDELKNSLESYSDNTFLYEKNVNSFDYEIKNSNSLGIKTLNKDSNKKIDKNIDKQKNIKQKIINIEHSDDEVILKLKSKIYSCNRCNLYLQKSNYVLGKGNLDADIMFIGEGPGAQEDITGLPFVGKSGELLTSIIEKGMKIKREDVYITNVVKCRPPNNRNPLDIEISSCINYLYEEIKLVNPKIIVLLGGVALRSLLPHYSGITRYRGHILNLVLKNANRYKVIPTYHPSYLLRGSEIEKRRKKQELWQDIKKVMDLIGLPY